MLASLTDAEILICLFFKTHQLKNRSQGFKQHNMSENTIKSTFFPHQALPKIYGEPTCQTLYNTAQRLRDNASAVKSTLGGGNHGLLALLLSPAAYHAITGHHWVEPGHPGNPPLVVAGTTQVQARNQLHGAMT